MNSLGEQVLPSISQSCNIWVLCLWGGLGLQALNPKMLCRRKKNRYEVTFKIFDIIRIKLCGLKVENLTA